MLTVFVLLRGSWWFCSVTTLLYRRKNKCLPGTVTVRKKNAVMLKSRNEGTEGHKMRPQRVQTGSCISQNKIFFFPLWLQEMILMSLTRKIHKTHEQVSLLHPLRDNDCWPLTSDPLRFYPGFLFIRQYFDFMSRSCNFVKNSVCLPKFYTHTHTRTHACTAAYTETERNAWSTLALFMFSRLFAVFMLVQLSSTVV